MSPTQNHEREYVKDLISRTVCKAEKKKRVGFQGIIQTLPDLIRKETRLSRIRCRSVQQFQTGVFNGNS